MWPFDLFRKRRYEREYKAALVVFLGAYGMDRLTGEERARVEARAAQNFNKSILGPSVAVLQWDVLAASRSAAMDRLGIETGIPGLSWNELFSPWHNAKNVNSWPYSDIDWDSRANSLLNDFRPMSQATQDAREFLRRNGIPVPEHEAWDPRTMLNEQQIGAVRPD